MASVERLNAKLRLPLRPYPDAGPSGNSDHQSEDDHEALLDRSLGARRGADRLTKRQHNAESDEEADPREQSEESTTLANPYALAESARMLPRHGEDPLPLTGCMAVGAASADALLVESDFHRRDVVVELNDLSDAVHRKQPTIVF